LSLVFHPDKQSDSELRTASQKIFHKIHTAYTGNQSSHKLKLLFYFICLVLSDQKHREIYDKYGVEGIETAWQLGPHLDQSEKLAEEIRKRNNFGLAEILQSKTSFTIASDFTEIVDNVLENDKLVYSDFLPKVTAVGVSETIETSFGAENYFNANFTTICQSGNVGSGNVSLHWRRPFPICGFMAGVTMDNGIGFGARKFLSTALMTQLDKSTTGSVQLVTGLRGGTVFPQFNASVSRVLNPFLVGTLQLIQPIPFTTQPGQLSLSLSTKTSAEVKAPLTVTVTVPTSGDLRTATESISLEAKKTFYIDSKHEIRVKFGGSEQNGGFLDCGIHRKWKDKTRASATLQLDQNIGVSLRLGITHNSLHLILPLRFSQEFSPSAMIIASLIPTLGDYLSRHYIYPHLLKKRKEQYWAEYRQKRASMMERKREEAELATELMKQNLEKKQLSPELRIIEASYRSIEHPELAWPVSVPLQFLLNSEGKIKLDPAYRANVLGFFDVAPGEAKETFILYEFRGKMHEAIIADSDQLLLPQRSHIKEE
jgi:hypothetical protein